MKLSELLPPGGIIGTLPPESVEISGVSDHTDHIRKGELFIAHKGRRIDPLSLLDVIEARGASALLLPQGAALPRKTSIPCFFAQDFTDAEAKVWETFYGAPQKELRLFAVTGTNGKTTTAKILSHLLCASGIPCGYIGTLGACLEKTAIDTEDSTMTTPNARLLYRTLRRLCDMGAKAVVLEVSSHALSQGRVARLHFESAIFTNLSEDHLDYHGTMEAYFEAKRQLFSQASLAIVNADDDYGARLLCELTLPTLSVAVIESADYSVTDLYENGTKNTEYVCCTPFGSFPVSYPLFGAFNVYNTMFAITAALCAGLCPEEVRRALLTLPAPKGRAEVLPLGREFTVIIDYAHTPDAMKSVIKSARKVTRGRLLVLFGAGGDREREKRPLMGAIAEELADEIILTSDNPREEEQERIFADILCGMRIKEKRTVIRDRRAAIVYALDLLGEGDTLLLLGKGHEEYLLLGKEKLPFSEREIIEEHLRKKETL